MKKDEKNSSDPSSPKVPTDDSHLMRFVPRKEQIRNPDTDAFEGVLNTAFKIRPCDDGGLSVTWVEHYGPKSTPTYAIAGAAFRDSQRSKKLPKSGYFAVGNAGECRRVALQHGKKIRFVLEAAGTNTGHVTVRRFSDEDRRLLDALAMEVFREHVSVISLNI